MVLKKPCRNTLHTSTMSLRHVGQSLQLTRLFLSLNTVITMQIMVHVGMWWATDCISTATLAWVGTYRIIQLVLATQFNTCSNGGWVGILNLRKKKKKRIHYTLFMWVIPGDWDRAASTEGKTGTYKLSVHTHDKHRRSNLHLILNMCLNNDTLKIYYHVKFPHSQTHVQEGFMYFLVLFLKCNMY